MRARYDPSLGREWIPVADPPSQSELERLRRLLAQPGVLQAWLAAMAFTRSGRIEQVDAVIAVVLDAATDLGVVLDRIRTADAALVDRFGWYSAGKGAISSYEPAGLEEHGIQLAPC